MKKKLIKIYALFNFNFILIYIIQKILVLIKNYLEDRIFECFFKEYNKLLFKKKKNFFSQHILMKSSRL